MRWLSLLVLVVGLGWAGTAVADECTPQLNSTFRLGLVNGETLAKTSDADMRNYLVGYVDALLMSPLYGAQVACADRVWNCLYGKPFPDIIAGIRKYLTDNPDKMKWSAHILLSNALFAFDVCPKDIAAAPIRN